MAQSTSASNGQGFVSERERSESSGVDDEAFCLTSHACSSSSAPHNSEIEQVTDSGATLQMTYDRSLFDDFTNIKPYGIFSGNGTELHATGSGSMSLFVQRSSQPVKCVLRSVIYDPGLR